MKRIRVHYLCRTPRGEITDFMTHLFEEELPDSFIQSTKEEVSGMYDVSPTDVTIQNVEYRS